VDRGTNPDLFTVTRFEDCIRTNQVRRNQHRRPQPYSDADFCEEGSQGVGNESRRFEDKGVSTLPCEPTRSSLNIIWSCGLFEGEGVSTSRVSPPPGPLSISYGHVGCLKTRAFPPSRVSPPGPLSISYGHVGCLKARACQPPV
jgi:hypothetical protein